MLSPTVLNNLHSTEAIPHSTEAIPHCTEAIPTVLSNLHSTEAIPRSTELTLYGVITHLFKDLINKNISIDDIVYVI